GLYVYGLRLSVDSLSLCIILICRGFYVTKIFLAELVGKVGKPWKILDSFSRPLSAWHKWPVSMAL
ncbi:hypothetical protein, partial [Anaerovibrio lipolyticus]|uniref:hypothetical protein n=1 Tax=Anaerovibrio lipolyticus TaxID=82374 RepID=UPI0026EBE43B